MVRVPFASCTEYVPEAGANVPEGRKGLRNRFHVALASSIHVMSDRTLPGALGLAPVHEYSLPTPASGTYSVQEANGTRTIQINNLPVDGRIGDWPMSRYAALTAIDPNPGTPAARSYTFTLPAAPAVNVTPTCLPLGAIGVTTNGVIIYNAADARGNDAVAHEIVDAHGGHPAQTDYHYHFVPERLDRSALNDGHSGIVGYIRDGFPIYGYKGVGGIELRNSDLDECHGHSHGSLGYHYHATLEYPYTVGCYRGTPR